MTERIMGDIYLEPEEEIIKNAKDIAQASKSAEKYIFRIIYEADEKSVVLSEIKRLECEILEHSDAKACVTVKASMAQLAAIKSLSCIEKVEMANEHSATTTESVTETMNTNETVETAFTEHLSLAAMEEESISTMCYDGDSGSDCDNSNTMQTAYYLPLSSWMNGCICCPGTEIWYRFTAGISNASEYIIYSSGSLDVVAYLYDSNGNYITQGDDEAGFPNFRITRQLTYGRTYYVRVKAYGNNTGNYNIRINYNIASSGGNNDDSCSNNMASAINLSLNRWQSGEICCPGAEIWYKFTPSTTAYYTIYTVGSLDTCGYIYDSNGTEIDDGDDEGSGLNFKMVQRLTAGQTYYIKARAYGSNTGYFSIAVTSTVFVETVSINQSYVYLDKGKTANLIATVTPSNATNKTLRWETSDSSVATVSQSGVVTARGAGTTCICAYSQDGSNKSSCCEVSVNVPVESVTINTSSLLMRVGEHDDLDAEICPTDAVNQLIRWTSTNTAAVWVNEATGRVEARGVGSATIYATAQDGTGVRGSCTVQVDAPIAVQGIDICCETATMNVGETTYLSYDIYPYDATNKSVVWCSSNPNVAEIDASTGRITAKLAGTTTITVTTNDGSYVASCELWVHGKTPVFLIHGRTSHSKSTWGINNDISSGKNNHFDSDINANSLNGIKYTDIGSQEINNYEPNAGGTETPMNLGIHLQNSGYNGNLNLFVFNYPNEDAVKYSAQKLKAYIDNLISYVRSSDSNQMKACFYASRSDYNANNYKINLIGHSMGGLISRYYIENLGQDNHVDKLITICTPHWGSGYGDLSSYIGSDIHVLCDHDLDLDSAMFGGNSSTNLNCDAVLSKCYNGSYTLTDELLYNKARNTKYYAIAGIDYPVGLSNNNDSTFELPTNFTTMQQIVDYFTEKGIYSFSSTNMSIIEIVPKSVGDNMVGFLSQIGWVGDNQNVTPEPRIQMEKIFVDVDTDGGNGGGIFVVEILPDGGNIFHSKVNHRQPVCAKVIEYLED